MVEFPASRYFQNSGGWMQTFCSPHIWDFRKQTLTKDRSCCWKLSFPSTRTHVVYSASSWGPWFLFLCRADFILGLCGLPQAWQAWGALWRGHLRCRRLHGYLRSLHLAGRGVLWRNFPGPRRRHPWRPPVRGRCLDTSRTRHLYRPARGRAIECCVELVGRCWWMLVDVSGDDRGLNMFSVLDVLAMNAFFGFCVWVSVCVWIYALKFKIVIYVYEIANQVYN